jgi:integrase
MTRGVEPRETSIRLIFAFHGKTERKTLLVNGEPMAPTPANLKYAGRLIDEIRTKIKAGVFVMAEYFPVSGNATVARGGTVGDQLDHWLGLQTIEASTKKGYEAAIKFWKNAVLKGGKFGDKTLVALRHSDILAALKTKPKFSGKTINNYVSVLRAAMQLAVLDQVLRDNPVAAIENATWQKEDPDPFELEEAEAILAEMRKGHPPSVVNMVEFRFFSGVRTSEMVGLRWSSIDFNKRHAMIREAVVLHERKDTKTSTVRTIHLNTRAFAAIKAQKEQTFLAGQAVFTDPRYLTPWLDERAFRRTYWTPVLKKLGIRYRPPNNMRHTYATMLLMAGAKPAYAAKQMGHSVEMFLGTYSKWIDGGHDELEQGKLESFIKAPSALKAANE